MRAGIKLGNVAFVILYPLFLRGEGATDPRTAIQLDFANAVDADFETQLTRELQRTAIHVLPEPSVWFMRRDFPYGVSFREIWLVRLTGNCLPQLREQSGSGPLGWVRVNGGQMESLVNVDCERIGQVLHPLFSRNTRFRMRVLICRAIARVLMHELIHIRSGSFAHASNGLFKPALSLYELTSEDVPVFEGVPGRRLKIATMRAAGY